MDKNNESFTVFKDIVGRIPYGAYFKVRGRKDIFFAQVESITDNGIINEGSEESFNMKEVIPLLRPISDVTPDEVRYVVREMDKNPQSALIDFYNAYGVDYRGLINKGLAEPMPEVLKKRVVPEVLPVGDA